MVRPGAFGRNEAAAQTNAFMQTPVGPEDRIAAAARAEFDALAAKLAAAGVAVVIDDEPNLPDSVFPNNWFSYHQPSSGRPVLITYPMATPERRKERRESVIERIVGGVAGGVERIDLTAWEDRGEFLEGTGSLVIDRVGGVAFACRSVRTSDRVLDAWSEATGIEVVRFDAVDALGQAIYHTNVMLSIGSRFGLVCSASIADARQRAVVLDRLRSLRPELLDISLPQMGAMCANILEIRGQGFSSVIAMSETAWEGFSAAQRERLEGLATPVVSAIPTIERVGGGSVRCMIAEIGG